MYFQGMLVGGGMDDDIVGADDDVLDFIQNLHEPFQQDWTAQKPHLLGHPLKLANALNSEGGQIAV